MNIRTPRLRWPALTVAAGVALTCAVLSGGPASASPGTSHRATEATKPGSVKPRHWIDSDPATYAKAEHSKDWVRTPEGLVYKSCAYSAPNNAVITTSADGTGEMKEASGKIVAIPACTHPTLTDGVASQSSQSGATKSPTVASPAATASCENGYPGWWAETCWRDSTWINSLTENFSMPSNPSSDGALFFIFPGLEDSGQDSILQPMLNWGANGNIVTNPNIYYIMSEYFWSGNFVHSPPKHVNPPGTVTGSIIASGCNSGGGGCTWLITTSVGSLSTSITVSSDPAYTLVDGGALEVPRYSNCNQMPTTGHEAFRQLFVTDHNGLPTPQLLPFTPSSHCGDYGSVSSTDSDLFWTP